MAESYMPSKAQSVDWGSPRDIIERFGPFDLDPAASHELHVCPHYFTKESNGLEQPWIGRVWLNPPYGSKSISAWLAKAERELESGSAVSVACLLPSKTEQPWWRDFIWSNSQQTWRPRVKHIEFTRRIQYLRPDGRKHDSAPFGSVVVVLK